MLTARAQAYACLEYIGENSVASFTEYTGTTATAVRRALVLAQNAALGELFDLNPSLFKREVGTTIAAPQTGTIAVTNGSATASASSFSGPFCGQTIQIAGQTEYNALRTEGATVKLLFPYTGTTGTQTATLWSDVLALDATLSRPLGPVWLSDIRILQPVAGHSELLTHTPSGFRSNWGFGHSGVTLTPRRKVVRQPEAYFADVHTLEAGTAQVRIFLSPMPDKVYSLRFDAGVRPIAVVDADIGTSDSVDPNRQFPLPDQNDERFLLPLVLYHWSRTAWFKNKDARAQIAADRAAIVPQIQEWKVQIQTGSHIQTGGYR